MSKKTQNRRRDWRGAMLVVALLVAGIGGFLVMEMIRGGAGGIESERRGDEINYEAPSEEEVATGEGIKAGKQGEEDAGDGVVAVAIVDAEQSGAEIVVRAEVNGVIEDGGVCQYAFIHASGSFEKTREGVANVGNTSCGWLEVPVSEFAAGGVWEVEVNYDGADGARTMLEVAK